MSFDDESQPGQGTIIERLQARLDEKVRLIGRTHQYTPASKFRTWLYVAMAFSVFVLITETIAWLYIGIVGGSTVLIIAIIFLSVFFVLKLQPPSADHQHEGPEG